MLQIRTVSIQIHSLCPTLVYYLTSVRSIHGPTVEEVPLQPAADSVMIQTCSSWSCSCTVSGTELKRGGGGGGGAKFMAEILIIMLCRFCCGTKAVFPVKRCTEPLLPPTGLKWPWLLEHKFCFICLCSNFFQSPWPRSQALVCGVA